MTVPGCGCGRSAGDLGEIGDVEGGGADLRQQRRRLARSAGSAALTVTLSKNASTGARSSASARMAPAKFSTLIAATVSPFTFSMAAASAFSSRPAAASRRRRRRSSSCPSSPRGEDVVARLTPASRLAPSSVLRNSPSASTRLTISARSSWPPSANTASIRSCRAPFSRRCTLRRSAKKARRSIASLHRP